MTRRLLKSGTCALCGRADQLLIRGSRLRRQDYFCRDDHGCFEAWVAKRAADAAVLAWARAIKQELVNAHWGILEEARSGE